MRHNYLTSRLTPGPVPTLGERLGTALWRSQSLEVFWIKNHQGRRKHCPINCFRIFKPVIMNDWCQMALMYCQSCNCIFTIIQFGQHLLFTLMEKKCSFKSCSAGQIIYLMRNLIKHLFIQKYYRNFKFLLNFIHLHPHYFFIGKSFCRQEQQWYLATILSIREQCLKPKKKQNLPFLGRGSGWMPTMNKTARRLQNL